MTDKNHRAAQPATDRTERRSNNSTRLKSLLRDSKERISIDIPSKPMKNFLVLDLDETIIDSKLQDFSHKRLKVKVVQKKKTSVYYVMPRPGLHEFIKTMKQHYTIFLYTNSDLAYAEAILEALSLRGYFEKIYDKIYCKHDGKKGLVKDLGNLELPTDRIVFLDDSKTSCQRYPGNSLQIRPFYGDPEDNSLAELTDFLIEMSSTTDIRPIQEKYTMYVKSTSPDVEDDIQDDSQNIPNILPEVGTKKLMSAMGNKYFSLNVLCNELRIDQKSRAKSEALLDMGTSKKRASWRVFQENLLPISVAKTEKTQRLVLCLDKKQPAKREDSLKISPGSIEEGHICSLENLERLKVQPKLHMRVPSIELDISQ